MSTNVGSVVSHFPSAQNGFTTTLAATIASGATTVPLNSAAGYTNGQTVVFVVDPSDPTKKQTFTGIMDTAGVQVINVVWTAGTNQTHSGGATVVDYATATHISMVTKGLLVQHSQAGAHTAVTATSVTTTGNISSSAGVISTTAASSLKDASTPLSTYRSEMTINFVASGGVWSGDAYASTRNASMTALVCYVNGRRISIAAVTARAFTASKDTYVDVLDNGDGTGTLVYTEATNNAASPALASNSLRIAIIVTGAGNIAAAGSVNQGQETSILPIASSIPYAVTDSLGNLICNRNPNTTLLGYRQITANVTGVTSTSYVQITGLTCPVIIPAGRKIKVSARFERADNTISGKSPFVGIFDGDITIAANQVSEVLATCGSSFAIAPYTESTFTPASSNKTYNVAVKVDGGSSIYYGTTTSGSGFSPAWIKVELV